MPFRLFFHKENLCKLKALTRNMCLYEKKKTRLPVMLVLGVIL